MTDDHDLDHLLRAVDDEGHVPESFIEDLFDDLSLVVRGERAPRRDVGPADDHSTFSVVGDEVSEPSIVTLDTARGRPRTRPIRWIAAVAAAVAIGALSIALLDRQTETTTTPAVPVPTTTTAPAPSISTEPDPVVACGRYADTVGSLDELAQVLGGATSETERAAVRLEIEAAVTATEQFEVDLAAAGLEAASGSVGLAAGGLRQAMTEIDQNDLGAAADSVRFASSQIGRMSPDIFDVAGPCLVPVSNAAMRN